MEIEKVKFKPASPKLKFLYEKHKYKLLPGGRGSTKSWGAVEALVYYSQILYKEPLTILCVREFQRSIKKSSKKLIECTIHRLGIQGDYKITENSIKHKITGSEFIFEGLARNLDSIKSMEGVNICWLEEGHFATQESIDVLLPTIRGIGGGGEFWCTWNPQQPTDPIESMVKNPFPDTVVQDFDYRDNPFFPDNLREQMEHHKANDYDKYLHIWEGKYKKQGDNKVVSYGSVLDAQKRTPDRIDTFAVAGIDPAYYGSDPAAIIIRKGNEILHRQQWQTCDIMQFSTSCTNLLLEYNVKCAVIDMGGGYGQGPYDLISQHISDRVCNLIKFNGGAGGTNTKYKNKRAQCWFMMADWINETGALPNDQGLVAELIQQEYFYTEQTQRQLVSKKKMKSDGIASPNQGDALSMTFDPSVRPPKQVKRMPNGVTTWAG